MDSVSSRCKSIFASLRSISQSPSSNNDDASSLMARDELARFSLWAGNLGALHQPGSSKSIESRLRDAPDVLLHVVEVLDDLNEVSRELLSITTGEREAEKDTAISETANEIWSQPPDNTESETHQSDGVRAPPPALDEAVELRTEIRSCITRLFRITRLVRRVVVTDPYVKALSRRTDRIDGRPDIAFIRDKYPKIAAESEAWLQDRLGGAITARREWLRYAQDHRAKLEPAGDHIEETVSKVGEDITTASSMPTTFLPDATAVAPIDFTSAMSDVGDDSFSMTSISPSIDGESEHSLDSRIPTLKSLRIGDAKEIECPFCFRLHSFRSEKSWRRHVMSDLRAYICTFPNCKSAVFENMDEWWHHEMQYHRVRYSCLKCQEKDFPSKEELLGHLKRSHAQLYATPDREALLELCGKPVQRLRASDCPCCNHWSGRQATRAAAHLAHSQVSTVSDVVAAKAFKRHLASHLEQIALFALPTLADGGADRNSKSTAASSKSDVLSMSIESGNLKAPGDMPGEEDESTRLFSEPMDGVIYGERADSIAAFREKAQGALRDHRPPDRITYLGKVLKEGHTLLEEIKTLNIHIPELEALEHQLKWLREIAHHKTTQILSVQAAKRLMEDGVKLHVPHDSPDMSFLRWALGGALDERSKADLRSNPGQSQQTDQNTPETDVETPQVTASSATDNALPAGARFVFRIDEIEERPDAPESLDHEGNWVPIAVAGWNVRKPAGHGVTYQWYCHDGQRIRHLPNFTPDSATSPWKVGSMFFNAGFGFWCLRGDATDPPGGETYHPLLFDHDEHTYASYLTHAGTQRTLRVQRPDAIWPSMLLPDIYHGAPYSHAGYGGLIGDLSFFLGLMAFSMQPNELGQMIQNIMSYGDFKVHRLRHGRTHKRGVVVYIYSVDGSKDELEAYERGEFGKYYN